MAFPGALVTAEEAIALEGGEGGAEALVADVQRETEGVYRPALGWGVRPALAL